MQSAEFEEDKKFGRYKARGRERVAVRRRRVAAPSRRSVGKVERDRRTHRESMHVQVANRKGTKPPR